MTDEDPHVSEDGVAESEARGDDDSSSLDTEQRSAAATGSDRRDDRSDRAPSRRPALRTLLSTATVGVVVLVVLALVCAGLIVAVVIKTRNDADVAAREAAAYTPPPLSSDVPASGSTGSADPDAEVVIIADQSATRGASGLSAAQRWPRLLEGSLDPGITTDASAGAGYTADGADGDTYVEAAAKISADARVVVFVGGGNDAGTESLPLARAATQAYAAASTRAPRAAVVVVGPLFKPASSTTAEFMDLRAALRSSARIAGATWIDPVGSDLLPTSVGAATDLTAANERTIARRLQSAIEAAQTGSSTQ